MSLVDRIKLQARDQHLSLAELERRLDLSQGSIRKWDDSSPSFDKVEKVADFFNVSTDYLVGRESYEEMKISQAKTDFDDDFMTLYRTQKVEIPAEEQENFKDEMKNYMEYLKSKYTK